MPRTIACPSCNLLLDVSGMAPRSIATCPKCGGLFAVPIITANQPAQGDDFANLGEYAVSNRRRKKSLSPAIVAGCVFVGLAVVLVAGVTVVFVITSLPKTADAPKPAAAAPTKPVRPIDRDVEKKPAVMPPAEPEKATVDETWIKEAAVELQAALENKPLPEPIAKPRGATTFEATTARQAADFWCRIFSVSEPTLADPFDVFRGAAQNFGNAGLVIPRTIAALVREARLRVANAYSDAQIEFLPQGLSSGWRPLLDPEFKAALLKRLPWRERKDKHAAFVAITGESSAWSLIEPFDNLTAEEMDQAIDAAKKARQSGLGSLTRTQRRMLLAAGATRFFEENLPTAAPR